MKRSIWIFLLAIVLPSIGLGWLALRSANEQQIILERRTAELYQKETDAVASAARSLIEEERRGFAERVRQLLASESGSELARDFAAKLSRAWTRPAIGFALNAEGDLISPSAEEARSDAGRQKFLQDNTAFLSGNTPATVYSVPAEELNRPEQQRRKAKTEVEDKAAADSYSEKSVAKRQQPAAVGAPPAAPAPAPKEKDDGRQSSQMLRNVAPQRVLKENAPAISQLVPATADFRALTSDHPEGVVTRFMQDRLEIVFWLRPPEAKGMIFGCLLSVDALTDLWRDALPDNAAPDYVLALLNDKARPVVTQPPSEKGRDWGRPFVASEIGEALPHWEAALYLMRPQQLQENARGVRRTLLLLIAAALAAIAFGGWAVFADARRQMALAQKKTDFVSNVSHELKTPLTSIRMFAEMMQSGSAVEEKRPQYLRIIVAEAERLTRLINNVLDFARLERKQKRYDFHPLDLHQVIARTWEGHELHLREQGFTTRWQDAPPPYPVRGDDDALAQILVNLLSNAEKYSADRKEVEIHSYLTEDSIHVSVLDRGSGVPPGEEAKIFEAFYRAHDSLASGIQGSGLGLTLAQRLAKEHGGEITYQAREGGGSNVTLRLPLTATDRARS
ncbi:MAG TPA: HAMP domain-containing sensor histidine kinase [Chthoniobacterales bacterium]|nr:HAMP domain-containing sensor histidine kinase [Chthoniobacterales bacterium]